MFFLKHPFLLFLQLWCLVGVLCLLEQCRLQSRCWTLLPHFVEEEEDVLLASISRGNLFSSSADGQINRRSTELKWARVSRCDTVTVSAIDGCPLDKHDNWNKMLIQKIFQEKEQQWKNLRKTLQCIAAESSSSSSSSFYLSPGGHKVNPIWWHDEWRSIAVHCCSLWFVLQCLSARYSFWKSEDSRPSRWWRRWAFNL